MGKFRPRLKGKGKRWRKGHSSSSNPETKKHREAAKSRFFQENLGQGNLTSDALKKHNAFLGAESTDGLEMTDGETTFGGTFKTFQTFATDWSECSNISFNRLLKGFRSDSALHKEMLAVLAAVTEVIKTNGGKESTTEYFAALMTTLDVNETEDSVAAVLSLLGMGIKGVPQNVLRLKFSETSKCFLDILTKFVESDNGVILRAVIGCLSVLLRAQELAVWNNSSTIQTFDSVLAFTIHSKPKVRKAAQHAVCAILKGSNIMLEENPPLHHPVAAHTAKFCIRQVETGGTLGSSTTTLHIFTMLKEILATFPKAQLKQACESILKVMTLGNILVMSCGMQALHGLFVLQPSTSSLPAPLNAQLISALYEYQPPSTDTQPTLAWLAVMQEAYINLGRCDLSLCCANLPRLFVVLTELWLSEKPELLSGTTRALEAVVQACLTKACEPSRGFTVQSTLQKIMDSVEIGFQFQYHMAWPHVLHLLGAIFEAAGEMYHQLLIPCVKTLGELRDSEQFTHKNELEFVIGKAVRTMGPSAVLSAIPLQVPGQETSLEFKRSWMLPVLKDNIRTAPLEFFITYFLPLASLYRNMAANFKKQNNVASRSYDLLQSQVWSLLPCFCNNPPDLKDSFKGIAKVLGTVISNHSDLRLSVMASLRKLILHNQELDNKENLEELARFAKNYLPILFNVYTSKAKGSDEEGQRRAALETIKVYLTLASPELAGELFNKANDKLDAREVDAFIKECVMDLLQCLLPYQNKSGIGLIFKRCKELTMSKNHHEQKKAYRLLEELCGSTSETCQEFVKENINDLQDLLISSSSLINSSKGPRLRCLISLMQQVDYFDESVVKQIMLEAVVCCKDINERCRSAAFALLVQIGECMKKWSEKPGDDIIRDYVGLLISGLAGSPSVVSATLLGLAKITHSFREIISADLLHLLLDNVCVLMTSSTREIVGPALSWMKVFITSFPMATIGPSVPAIMKSFVAMADDCKRHFRIKCKNILNRLIRKFGYEAISKLVPASEKMMHKRLRNLCKINAKKKQQYEEDAQSDDDELFAIKGQPRTIEEILADSEESDIESDTPENTKPSSKKKHNTWIKEDADTIVDFTDTSAIKKITVTHPAMKGNHIQNKKKKQSEFKVAPDGRLIIAADSDSEDEREQRKKHKAVESDSSEDEMPVKGLHVSGRKRQLSTCTDDTTSEPAPKYQAGGSGIHRPIARSKLEQNVKNNSSSPGAEYRSKKALGDVKKKGLPDPYAYLPLSRKFLNKRKNKKNTGHFTNIVHAAHKGARSGARAKRKMTQRRK